MSASRFKSFVKSRLRIGKQAVIEKDAVTNFTSNSESAFLRLPVEIRLLIYGYAFDRTPTDHLRALQAGPAANSASGLMLSCRRIQQEVDEYFEKDVVVSSWPHKPDNNHPYPHGKLDRSEPFMRWQSTHNSALIHGPRHTKIQNMAVLIDLNRSTLHATEHYHINTTLINTTTLRPKHLYLRLCTCRVLTYLHCNHTLLMEAVISLETFAYNFPTLAHIHVMSCSGSEPALQFHSRNNRAPSFGKLVFEKHKTRMFSGANWSVAEVGAKKRSWGPIVGRDQGQIQPMVHRDVEDGAVRGEEVFRTVMTWNVAQAHPGDNTQQVPWTNRKVSVDYYDSMKVCGGRCVKSVKERPDFEVSCGIKESELPDGARDIWQRS